MPTFQLSISVRLTGLEPAHREILDPKSSASTNSATGACLLFCGCKGTKKKPNGQIFEQRKHKKVYFCVESRENPTIGQIIRLKLFVQLQ